jgi:lipoprotein-anchoring transpeptidase ErfK/SrfK
MLKVTIFYWGHIKMRDAGSEDDAQTVQRIQLALFRHLITQGHLPTPQTPQPRSLIKEALWGSLAILVVLAGVWTAGNVFAMNFALQGTDLSARNSNAQLQKAIDSKVKHYRLAIAQPDGRKQTYSLDAASIKVDNKASVIAARKEQQSMAHRLQWWKPIPIKLVISADTEMLQAFIALHALITVDPAHDASLTVADGSVEIVDGIAGKQYGLDNPTHVILEAASNLQTKPLQMHDTVQQPTITKNALTDAKQKLDGIFKQTVMLKVDDQEIKPDSREISSWITVAPNNHKKNVDINVNKENVQKYVESVANKQSHPSRTQTVVGGSIVTAGQQGVAVGGTEEAANTISDQLLAAKGVTVTLPTQHTAFKTVSAPTNGKWIEVDITTKRMYVYNQNTLQRTFLVSAGAAATPTVTGTFAIYSKYPKKTMTGANADGSNYLQPDVPWTNFFYRDYAIHGNYWRPGWYFGAVNSSHGCVGLTVSDAAWVYTWAPVGTPVVVHK